MSDHWQEMEKQAARPKIEPWLSFGVTLVIAVIAVLFAAGTWVIRTGQTDRAQAKSLRLSESLDIARRDLDNAAREKSDSDQQIASQQHRISDLETTEKALKDDLAKLGGELQSVKRELEGTKETLSDLKSKDTDPATLPPTNLKEILKNASVRVRVFVQDDKNTAGLTEGAIILATRQKLETNCGFSIDDSSATFVNLRVIAVSTFDDRTAITATMRIEQPWKAPGLSNMHWVSIWQQQTLGVTTPQNAQTFTEQLIGQLVAALASALKS